MAPLGEGDRVVCTSSDRAARLVAFGERQFERVQANPKDERMIKERQEILTDYLDNTRLQGQYSPLDDQHLLQGVWK